MSITVKEENNHLRIDAHKKQNGDKYSETKITVS